MLKDKARSGLGSFLVLLSLTCVSASTAITKYHLNAMISQHYAHTTGTIVLANDGDLAASVKFRLHLPEAAYVSGLNLTVDGQTFVGEVKKMEDARADFADAVQAGNEAGLLESRGMSAFEMVVNVGAQSSAEFQLSYDELLHRKGGEVTYKLTLDPGEVVEDFLVAVNIREEAAIAAVECSLEEAVIEYAEAAPGLALAPKHATILYAPTPSQQRAASQRRLLASEGVAADMLVKYDTASSGGEEEGAGLLLYGDGYFLHYFSNDVQLAPAQGGEAGGESIPKHIVFVVDSSGSMEGDKMAQTKDAFEQIVISVDRQDKFQIIDFASSTRRWTDALEDASPANVDSAIGFIRSIEAGGGTNIEDSLVEAFQLLAAERKAGVQDVVILLTDGQAAVSMAAVTGANPAGEAALYTLGLGEGVDYALLRALALSNGGFYRQIYADKDAAEQVVDFYSEVSTPVLLDLVFSYEPAPDPASLTTSSYRSLMQGSEIMVAGALPAGAPSLAVSVEALAPSGEVSFGAEVALAPTGGPLDAIGRRMWALLQIEQLRDVMALAQLDPEAAKAAEAEALALALQEQLVVEGLTSLVVVAVVDDDGDDDVEPVDEGEGEEASEDGGLALPGAGDQDDAADEATGITAASAPTMSSGRGGGANKRAAGAPVPSAAPAPMGGSRPQRDSAADSGLMYDAGSASGRGSLHGAVLLFMVWFVVCAEGGLALQMW